MTTVRRMPALSPEEIRKISEKAVATVAAQKIVTKHGVLVKASMAGTVMSKASSSDKANTTKASIQSGSSLTQRARNQLAQSGLSPSDGRKYLQESFNQVRKTLKA